jgi:serine/threonine protein kinase
MKEIDLQEIGIKQKVSLDEGKIDLSLIPFGDIFGNILDNKKKYRCNFIIEKDEFIGGYGIINFAKRIDRNDVHGNTSKKCIIKKSIDISYNVLQEAFLQYISYNILKNYKLEYMVPKVFDIFKKNNNIYFSMERIFGQFIHLFLLNSNNPEKDFIFCFLQISIVLHILEKIINLDHRDLRVTNIYVVNKPTEFNFTINHKTYTYNCDFHICILDFGFACIGLKPTIINATEEIFNINQRCFKPGRDLFQLLISLLSLESIKNKFTDIFYNKISSLLGNNKNLLSTKYKADLSYIATLDDDFKHEFLLPENFINFLIHLLDTI